MQTITTEQLRGMRQNEDKLHLINVLDKDKFEAGHIPGSENVPVMQETFTQDVEERVNNKEDPIVVYCASKDCDASPTAAQKLEKAGFENVYDYEGGTKAWHEAGYEVETPKG